MNKKYEVTVNLQQDFTAAEQAQGRDNIGAASASDVTALQSQVSSLSDVSAYTVKGEATVAQLNAGPSGIQAGWAYQLTDSGTLTDGTLAVVAGDTVAWDGTKWFPLVKSDYYYTKSQMDTLLAGKQKTINIVTGAPIILDADGNMDLKISDGSFVDDLPESGLLEQIGDKFYRVAKMPDGKIWMCENLDYGSDGVYYNNDGATYGWNGLKYGKLYTWDEAVASANAISGWHLASTAEWDALVSAVGGAGVAGTKLKSSTGWSSNNGTDDFGFAAFPAGLQYSGSFNYLGSNAYFWTDTERSSSDAYSRYFSTGASMSSNYYNKSRGCSVRLIKD